MVWADVTAYNVHVQCLLNQLFKLQLNHTRTVQRSSVALHCRSIWYLLIVKWQWQQDGLTADIQVDKWWQFTQWYQTTMCLKNAYPFYFCDYSVKCWPILIIYSNIAAEKICNQMTYSFSIISSLCMNITEYKNNRDSICCCPFTQFMVDLCCHRASFLQLFQKFVQSPTFIQKLLNKFLLHNL